MSVDEPDNPPLENEARGVEDSGEHRAAFAQTRDALPRADDTSALPEVAEWGAGVAAKDKNHPKGAALLQGKSTFRGLLIHSLLGEGNMGQAYLASHPVLRTPMVVKLFKGEVNPAKALRPRRGASISDEDVSETSDAQAVARPEAEPLLREAALAARVRSHHVVEVLDAGVRRGVPFLVQRYIDGIDLREVRERTVARGWRIPTGALARLLCGAALGVHAAHQAGVIHRDIKPANLFIRGDGHCCVGDFGVALDRSRATRRSTSTGTPVCMAPEQWRHEAVDRRTDVYALGATAHWLATGRGPFDVGGVSELAFAHCEEPYVAPVESEPEAAYFFAVVARCLEKAPEARYPTALAVARALEVIATPPPAIELVPGGARVGELSMTLFEGDLSRMSADVIVSAANWRMSMAVGVARALAEVGGRRLIEAAVGHSPAAMGAVAWTDAGDLDATWVAHAVSALNGAICLQRCVLRVLLEADARGARKVLFPALGTGVGQVPMAMAATLMMEATRTLASLGPRHLREVGFVLYGDSALKEWREALAGLAQAHL